MRLDVIRSIWPWLFLLSMSVFFEVWARLAYDTSFLFNLFNIQSILTFAAAPLLLG
ncbi:MAG: ribose ABC transporter, partial [Deltaproteobacteria bacterium]